MKFILVLLSLMMFSHQKDNSNQLVLNITNIKNSQGVIRVLLFKDGKGFPDTPENAFQSANVKIVKGKSTVTFENIPNGFYAISVFHDSMNTGKLRTNSFGIPKDGYGFSNNAMGTFGPPSFEKAAFEVSSGSKSVEIQLR